MSAPETSGATRVLSALLESRVPCDAIFAASDLIADRKSVV